ncbi:PREDICTED: uncharacterized protein LOC105448247 isoform X2 [Wasmannia auropunctata]|uniref:uncharacterized protein LOC105448247 isoform X2 n=1 Tax=Wasmannia auropunctata TaxID=64793 RepID=UPI0005EDDD67|nr:PREDICTED: uncharacterized protein LOC105448247 isoform X2 [Wasmannia auropunctata]
MCDLIDLNSPDARGALKSAKLASPLIPAPRSIEHVDGGTGTTESAAEKREGDGNNPFDRVLHETAEYVSKKGDPFEVMLQRALRSKSWRNAQPVGFTDDFTPKKKKRYCKTMNKTLGMLDELFLESRFGLFDVGKREARIKAGRGVGVDARDADVRADSNAADDASASKQEPKIFAAASDSLELSILNQSAMNDTLLDVFPKSKENGEVSPFLETDTSFREFVFPSNRLHHFKLRSLSQGTGKSPTGPSYLNKRSQSVTDGRRTVSQSDNSTVSSFLDRGFMESRQSEQSVFSSLSNVSSITKLTSASLSSSILSNDAINHAFLDDGSSRTSRERTTAIESSMEVKLKEYDLTDLAERLNKLKCAMNDTTNISSVTEDSSSTKREDNKRTTSSKLIDVDVFVPEPNKEFNRSSSSTCSSDSVFTNTNKVDKSILKEAKVLAKTFEEMALKTDSGSTTDDLISNNTLWMSELLPAFEDEPVVNNLIDLPGSPEGHLKNIQNSDKKQSSASIDSAEELFKKMESSLTDAPAVKQDVTSLLSDLRKLVKTESNPEAKKLLDNLENILDINYKNNTELLMSCFNVPNKSSRSPQKVSSESIERFDKSSVDKSEDTSGKASFQEKLCNAEKSLSDTTSKSEDTSRDALSIEKSFSSCKDNNEDRTSTTHSSDKDNQVDKKVAIELLVNLRKLLSGQAEDDVTMQLLKNIGKVLNTALNNGTESETRANCTGRQNIQQTTPVRKPPESARDVHSSALSTKVAQRRSLEPKSKTVRRSVSAVESSPKNTSSTQIRRRRSNVSESENHQKRLSGNPGFINNLNSNKKLAMPEARNTRKAEAAKPDSKKENSIAVSAPVLSDVKNKLKKRSDVVNKRGPVKAVHPVDNMKKRASLGRQTQSSRVTTPPKSSKATSSGSKIISSTPNSTDNCYMPKKPTKSKPIASSTPDQNSAGVPLASANKKRNFSCDISPVTTYANMSGSDERKESPPKRMSKLPTPKKCTTPTRQRSDGIPRFLTPPRHYSSSTNNPQSPQRLNRSLINFQRYSPLSEKQSVEKVPRQSPLKEANRITAKVKPLNLISKIKRHSQGDFGEKENYV